MPLAKDRDHREEDGVSNPLRRLGKDMVVYAFGGLLARSVGFITLSVYTRTFSPAEYGTLELLLTMVGFAGVLMNLEIDSAQTFHFFEQKKHGEQRQRELIGSALRWRLIWSFVIVVVLTGFAPILNVFFFQGELLLELFLICFVAAAFSQIMNQSIGIFRLTFRPWSFIIFTVLSTASSIGTAIVAILVFQLGVISIFVGMLISSLVFAALGWWSVREYLSFEARMTDWWPRLIKFGAPLYGRGNFHFYH